jgi:asparagine synthase (glutamine-hydrolysing)
MRCNSEDPLSQVQYKYIFKAALEPHVRKEILYRPKQGFAVPLAEWL